MKKALIILFITIGIVLSSCSTTEKVYVGPAGVTPVAGSTNKKVASSPEFYLRSCALPGDGSGFMPGTFILPSSLPVAQGEAVQDGAYIYAAGSGRAKNKDGSIAYLAASEIARTVCREAYSRYFDTSISVNSGRTETIEDGIVSGSSFTKSSDFSKLLLEGMVDCGYCEGSDGTIYILVRIANSTFQKMLDGRL